MIRLPTKRLSIFLLLFILQHQVDAKQSFNLKVLSKLAKSANQETLGKSRDRREAEISFAKQHLMKYGYVAPDALKGDGSPAALQSWEKALMEYQEFLGLDVTGEFNQETMEMMQKPRCANPDKVAVEGNLRRRRYVAVGSQWNQPTVTYNIINYTPKLGKKLTHEAIDAAFRVWGRHTPIKFVKLGVTDDADIKTLFAEGFHNDNTAFDGVGGYLAHAYYPGSGIGGDTHFDGAEPWTLHEAANQGNDLFLVAVHELGHALGLGHSSDSSAIMAPIYKYHDTNNFVLPQDDIYGIQSIYGVPKRRPSKPISPNTELPPAATTVPTTTYKMPTKRPFKPPVTYAPTTRTTTTTKPDLPDVCALRKYDAITYLRGELYLFSGQYMWRKWDHQKEVNGPFRISEFWPEVEKDVDAVYENQNRNLIYFFKGHMFWVYQGTKLLSNYPRHVRALGLQNEHIGAAVWWHRNGKSYFFKGEYYWRFSGDRVEKDYPKKIDVWKGVPSNVDAAFAGNGIKGRNYTYFVNGTDYLVFDNWKIQVIRGARSFRVDWLGCDVITKEEGQSTSVPAIVSVLIVIVALVICAICYVVWRRRQVSYKGTGTSVTVSGHPYTPGFTNRLAGYEAPKSGQKTMCVTAAQQKIRRIHYTFQGKV
uniref:Matrix metalloproteinase-14-like n=1 Tax=Phallusia mammillata TaxID=59560 RepID=A0A6F9DL68_9ASCI|nr:matrix metalloproteinase-14-like [Phallusia mammillata]